MSIIRSNELDRVGAGSEGAQLLAHSLRHSSNERVAACKNHVVVQQASMLLAAVGDGVVGAPVQWQCLESTRRSVWIKVRLATS